MWLQKELVLGRRGRGFHLVTREILAALPELRRLEMGLAHLFIKHTSASLALSENADPDVRHDLERHFNELVPENKPYYRHTAEGPDDMPAHLKNVMLGSGLTLPITGGRLNLGIWQGIYLCEHRDRGGARTVVATLSGQAYPRSSE